MNRCYFGAVLLVVILILSLCVTWAVSRCQTPVAEALEQASGAALREDRTQAEACIRRAESRWRRWRDFSAAVVDHAPMESIDGLFAQLDALMASGDWSAAAALSADLSRQVEAIVDAHCLNWWSIL